MGAVLDITLEPSSVAMDHGVLVWHWFTANNGAGFVGGEEFMNCADVRISPSGSDPVPTAAPFSTTSAAPVTTTSPEISTTTGSTNTAGGVFCKGNPARWTTDEQCAQCATGYKWWPCNEAELCFCTGALSQLGADEPKTRRIKSHKFLSH